MRVSSMARPGAGCGCGCDRAIIRWAVVRVGGGWVDEWCWPLPPKHTVQQRQHCRHQLHCLPPPATGTVASVASLTPTFSPGSCLCSWSVKIVHSIFHFSLIFVSPEQLTRGEILFCHPQNIIKEKRCKSPGTRIFSSRVKMASTWTPTGNTKEDQRRRDQVSNLYPSYPLYCSKKYFLFIDITNCKSYSSITIP